MATITPEPSRQYTLRLTPSIISRDLKIKGDLICHGDIQIDAALEGDVQSRAITSGEGADTRGTLGEVPESIPELSSLFFAGRIFALGGRP